MAGDELVRRLGVAVVAPGLGQHVFLLAIPASAKKPAGREP